MRNESLVLKIFEKCMKLDSLGQDSFFSFSGHVKTVDVRVCNGKWKNIENPGRVEWDRDYDKLFRTRYYGEHTSDTKKLKEIIEKLEVIEKEVM